MRSEMSVWFYCRFLLGLWFLDVLVFFLGAALRQVVLEAAGLYAFFI